MKEKLKVVIKSIFLIITLSIGLTLALLIFPLLVQILLPLSQAVPNFVFGELFFTYLLLGGFPFLFILFSYIFPYREIKNHFRQNPSLYLKSDGVKLGIGISVPSIGILILAILVALVEPEIWAYVAILVLLLSVSVSVSILAGYKAEKDYLSTK